MHIDRCTQNATEDQYIQVNARRTAQTGQIHIGQCMQNGTEDQYIQIDAHRSIQIAGQGFADTEACLFIKSHRCGVFGGYLQCYRQSPSFAKIVKGKG